MGTLGMVDVLFVCTGNLCRSPSAALLLRQQLGDARPEVRVHSAGTVETDFGSPRPLVEQGRAFGIDLGAHVPRTVDPGMVQAADLVVGLTRQHVRETVIAVPSSFPKTFTLREIVRGGLHTGPRGAGEDLGAWLARLHEGRLRADLMGDDAGGRRHGSDGWDAGRLPPDAHRRGGADPDPARPGLAHREAACRRLGTSRTGSDQCGAVRRPCPSAGSAEPLRHRVRPGAVLGDRPNGRSELAQ